MRNQKVDNGLADTSARTHFHTLDRQRPCFFSRHCFASFDPQDPPPHNGETNTTRIVTRMIPPVARPFGRLHFFPIPLSFPFRPISSIYRSRRCRRHGYTNTHTHTKTQTGPNPNTHSFPLYLHQAASDDAWEAVEFFLSIVSSRFVDSNSA